MGLLLWIIVVCMNSHLFLENKFFIDICPSFKNECFLFLNVTLKEIFEEDFHVKLVYNQYQFGYPTGCIHLVPIILNVLFHLIFMTIIIYKCNYSHYKNENTKIISIPYIFILFFTWISVYNVDFIYSIILFIVNLIFYIYNETYNYIYICSTISEQFKNSYKIIMILIIFNFIYYWLRKDIEFPVIFFSMMIFFFDTNTRKEKICNYNTKNYLHMLMVILTILSKMFFYKSLDINIIVIILLFLIEFILISGYLNSHFNNIITSVMLLNERKIIIDYVKNYKKEKEELSKEFEETLDINLINYHYVFKKKFLERLKIDSRFNFVNEVIIECYKEHRQLCLISITTEIILMMLIISF